MRRSPCNRSTLKNALNWQSQPRHYFLSPPINTAYDANSSGTLELQTDRTKNDTMVAVAVR